jgi:hypothetical protein
MDHSRQLLMQDIPNVVLPPRLQSVFLFQQWREDAPPVDANNADNECSQWRGKRVDSTNSQQEDDILQSRRALSPSVEQWLNRPHPNDTGPWKAFIMLNLNPTCKTHTILGVAKDPEEIERNYNQHHYAAQSPRQRQGKYAPNWNLVMSIGPFLERASAIRFSYLWSCNTKTRGRTRGAASRISRGLYLWKKYKKLYVLSLFYTTETKEQKVMRHIQQGHIRAVGEKIERRIVNQQQQQQRQLQMHL